MPVAAWPQAIFISEARVEKREQAIFSTKLCLSFAPIPPLQTKNLAGSKTSQVQDIRRSSPTRQAYRLWVLPQETHQSPPLLHALPQPQTHLRSNGQLQKLP